MTFNVEERHALIGAGAAAVVPTVVGEIGVDNLLVSFADAVFEGDRGSAGFVSGIRFGTLGLLGILGSILLDVDGIIGMLMTGLGGGLVALAIQTFRAGGDG